MPIVINAAIIEDGRILLLEKRDVWILPGGKLEENETHEECLHRENREELEEADIRKDKIPVFYSRFKGTSPHGHKDIEAIVYFTDRESRTSIKPCREITNVAWLTYQESRNFNLSDLTREIVERLHLDKYI